jgi:hypothetical protein
MQRFDLSHLLWCCRSGFTLSVKGKTSMRAFNDFYAKRKLEDGYADMDQLVHKLLSQTLTSRPD